MLDKPLFTLTIDGTKYNVAFEHYSPKYLERQGLVLLMHNIQHYLNHEPEEKYPKVQPGTACLLSIDHLQFEARSRLRAGDKFNGNRGMLQALANTLDFIKEKHPDFYPSREHRTMLFTKLQEVIDLGTTSKA